MQVFARQLIIGLLLILTATYGSGSVAAEVPGAQSGHRIQDLQIVTRDGREHRFRIEIADNAAARRRGLMFRKSLAPDAGMLFDFKTPQHVSFWMKNTLIPLDMLFLDSDGYIINLAPNVPPLSDTNIPSGGVVRAVLEIRGGRSAELGIEPGDRVRQRIFGR